MEALSSAKDGGIYTFYPLSAIRYPLLLCALLVMVSPVQ